MVLLPSTKKEEIPMPIPQETIDFLNRVKQRILEVPERLDLNTYLCTSEYAPCGVVGCLAGHIVMQDKIDKGDKDFIERIKKDKEYESIVSDSVRENASARLGLSEEFLRETGFFASRQFYTMHPVQETVLRIDSFIKSDGVSREYNRYYSERGYTE